MLMPVRSEAPLGALQAYVFIAMDIQENAKKEVIAMEHKHQVRYAPHVMMGWDQVHCGMWDTHHPTPSVSKTSSSNVCAPCLMLWEMQVLTDYAVQEERADSKWAATCQVRACGGNKAHVQVTNTTNSPWRLVDFDNKKCSCLRWQQMLRPCEHALAAYKQKVSPRSMRL